jgi:hypothetical protein
VGDTHHHIPEVDMNRTVFPFRNLAPLVTIVLGILLLTAAQAAASQPPPGRGEMGGTHHRPVTGPMHHVANSAPTGHSWVLFSAAILAPLVVGAVLVHVSRRRRAQLAH